MSSNPYDVPYQKDSRGFIKRHNEVDVNYSTIFTKGGVFRGGEIHPCAQSHFILKGIVIVSMYDLVREEEKIITLFEGQHHLMPMGIAHLFETLEDTLMIDMYHGDFSPTTYHEPYRSKVDTLFK